MERAFNKKEVQQYEDVYSNVSNWDKGVEEKQTECVEQELEQIAQVVEGGDILEIPPLEIPSYLAPYGHCHPPDYISQSEVNQHISETIVQAQLNKAQSQGQPQIPIQPKRVLRYNHQAYMRYKIAVNAVQQIDEEEYVNFNAVKGLMESIDIDSLEESLLNAGGTKGGNLALLPILPKYVCVCSISEVMEQLHYVERYKQLATSAKLVYMEELYFQFVLSCVSLYLNYLNVDSYSKDTEYTIRDIVLYSAEEKSTEDYDYYTLPTVKLQELLLNKESERYKYVAEPMLNRYILGLMAGGLGVPLWYLVRNEKLTDFAIYIFRYFRGDIADNLDALNMYCVESTFTNKKRSFDVNKLGYRSVSKLKSADFNMFTLIIECLYEKGVDVKLTLKSQGAYNQDLKGFKEQVYELYLDILTKTLSERQQKCLRKALDLLYREYLASFLS